MSGNETARSLISRLFSRESFNVDWKKRHGKSMCPPKKGKVDSSITEDTKPPEADMDLNINKQDPDTTSPRKEYVSPRKTCPSHEQCCYIKMQDPREPCCSDHTTDLPPCPPKKHHIEPREPICQCDTCKKRGGRCCQNGYRSSNVDPRYFQQA